MTSHSPDASPNFDETEPHDVEHAPNAPGAPKETESHDVDVEVPSLDSPLAAGLRRTVLIVALLNLAYFFVEMGVALAIGSVSLFADSVDFLEDTAVNLLIFIALGWPLARRARMGKVMALIILAPAAAALVMAVIKFNNPEAPDPMSLMVTSGGSVVVNSICAYLLTRYRDHGGSMTKAAWLAARNDVIINLAIIAMGVITLTAVPNGWPDLLLGVFIIVLNFGAAKEVWEVAEEESLAAKALAGEDIDDD